MKTSYIQSVLSYIEQNLTCELNPEDVAERHFVSLSRLYRDFYARTGHSVKEYIRKRRISNACEKIKCSETPLAIIAEESGCATQQAFHKQFKSLVGMTPLMYRQADAYFYFYPFAVDEIGLAVKVGTETIPAHTITRFYDSRLNGIEDRAVASLGEVSGRVFGRNGKQIGNQLCYELMTEIPGDGGADTYATCVVNYNEPEISGGWNYLYNSWLPSSMFEQSDGGYFEEYLFKNGTPRKLKLYLPVKKKKAARHIAITQSAEMKFVTAREIGRNAERMASEKVMNYMRDCFPVMLRQARRFYVCEHGGGYTCGLEWDKPYDLSGDAGVDILHIPAGSYAVLPDDCLGDIRVGSEKIEAWCANNGIPHENEPVFAVYETSGGNYDAEHVQMKLYKRLKS